MSELIVSAVEGLRVGPLPAQTKWLRAGSKAMADNVGVDREQRAILGFVVAQEGPFREPEPRGEFDERSLRLAMKLMKSKPNGTKMRFGHPSLSGDALGTYVARARNPRLSTVKVMRDGEQVELKALRADAHLMDSAFESNPNGNLGEYLLTLAEEDPDALGSSLVLQVDEEFRLDNHGKPKLDDSGKPLPPLWRPTAIHASDFVDDGAAVDGLLSAGINVDGLPDAVVRQAWVLLDRQFPDATADVIRTRCLSWLERYLSQRFQTPEPIYVVSEGGEPIYHDSLPEDNESDDGGFDALDLAIKIREREAA